MAGDGCDPDRLPLLPQLCVEVLGETGTTRALAGGHQVNAPFLHHGDLVVVGDLDLAAPFVVTGSLTVEDCLADCGPDSLVAVGGCITAEVVYGHYNWSAATSDRGQATWQVRLHRARTGCRRPPVCGSPGRLLASIT
ncbi:hypothetical protein ACGFYU_11210 [Streptomyces sp. NPDC048337]|uniref:hypothetical protein n=1 Tax=Streptomyces sp. NPDC048337 TaxID=3365535 RepID=UPI00371D4B57